jgi:hypothetical protein
LLLKRYAEEDNFTLMEPFSIAQLFTRRWPIILGLTLVVFAAAWWVDSRKDADYFGSLTVTVQAARNYPETEQLILQTSQNQDLQTVIATTQNWIADPYYVRRALDGAGVESGEMSLKEYASVFKPFSAVPGASTYQVQYVGNSDQEVRNVFQSLRTVLEEANGEYDNKGGELRMLLTFTDATVTSQSSGVPMIPIAGLLAGLIFASLIAALYDRSVKA